MQKTGLPGGIGLSKPGRRRLIRAKAQQHECRQSPPRPALGLICGVDEPPQPTHRGGRAGIPFISRTRDDCNRNLSGDPPPAPPLIELRKIIAAHQPDEALFRIEFRQLVDRVDREARAKPLLDRAHSNGRVLRHLDRRGKPRGKGGHIACRFLQRVAGRDEPPHFVEVERCKRRHTDRSVTAVRGVERPAKDADAGQGSLSERGNQFSLA